MPTKEYFIVAHSFAAPFCSDESTGFQKAGCAADALEAFAKKYNHPCGLYAADCYNSSDDYHKDKKVAARYLSNHAKAIEDAKPTSLRSDGPGLLVLDGKKVTVKNPKRGQVVAA